MIDASERARLTARGCEPTEPEPSYHVVRKFLSQTQCEDLITGYTDDDAFRSRISMQRHQFGRGEYSYFRYPLPALVESARTRLYPLLVPWANRIASALNESISYPPTHGEFVAQCHRAGQTKPTALVLRYGVGDYNRLHRDLYGDTVFPIQGTVLLSDEADFDGGEFVLVENRPRQQSIATVVSLQRGDLVLFPVCDRPVPGVRRTLRATLRHGVSEVTRGSRWTLGLIFHDAA